MENDELEEILSLKSWLNSVWIECIWWQRLN